MKRTILLVVPMILFLSGCAVLSHLQELLRLQAFSKNQDEQTAYIKEVDRKFNELLQVIKEGRIQEFPDKESFRKEFGDPIYIKVIQKGNQKQERWLYRYAVIYNKEKVYVYFNEAGRLVDWDLVVPATKKEEKSHE